jgi:hypothetical protein
MTSRRTLTLVLMTSMLLSLISFTTAQGQTRRIPIADTGVVSLGPDEVLRLTVAAGDVNGDGDAVQFRQVAYTPPSCNAGVCKHTVVSQSTSAPVTLMAREAASINIDSYSWGVRAIVLSDNPNVRVTAMIIDKTTGNIIGMLIDG